MKLAQLAAIVLCGFSPDASAGSLETLYKFKGLTDGSMPLSSIFVLNDTIYGFVSVSQKNPTFAGAYSYSLAMRQLRLLHTFDSANDGGPSSGALVYLNGLLYGETAGTGSDACNVAGVGFCGTVYSIYPISLSYNTLHVFMSGGTDGAEPQGGATLFDGNLYGVTLFGGLLSQGEANAGMIFKFDPVAKKEQSLHTITGGASGANPFGPLLLMGRDFFGTTFKGGTTNYGALFKVSVTGSNYRVLHSFGEGAEAGHPKGSLIYRNKFLFGTTDLGSAFKIQSFSGKEAFDVPNNSGGLSLARINSALYGVTYSGGDFNCGTIYAMNAKTGATKNLYSFTCGADGGYPASGLTAMGNVLYGTTGGGYTGNGGYGTIFKFTP